MAPRTTQAGLAGGSRSYGGTHASPWAGLKSSFLEQRPSDEQLRIFDLSARTAQTLHRWAARYPLIRRVRVWPLALSVAAAAPFSPLEALISTARLSLWVFTLDDLFDEERVPHPELLRRTTRYRGIINGESPAGSGDSLASALTEVRDDLKRYPLFECLGGEWGHALIGTMDEMIREHDWRLAYRGGEAGFPSYEEYLATGLYSIGGPPHIWAALITCDDATTPDHLPHLKSMEKIASTCIRLANDLRSYPKEIAEEKINAPIILSRLFKQEGASEEQAHLQAEQYVRRDIQLRLERLGELRRARVTATGRPEAAIDDIARFVCDFYTEHDYHTFLAQAS